MSTITKIQLNLDHLRCTGTSIGPGGDDLQIVSELYDTTTATRVKLYSNTYNCRSLHPGESIGSKTLWSFNIPATWGVSKPWPDQMELDVTINKIESFLQAQPIASPPAPPPPAPAPGAVGQNVVIAGPLGTSITFDPLAIASAIGRAITGVPKALLKLALESQLAYYPEVVDGAAIRQAQLQGGVIFTHSFVDNGAGKQKKFGAYGSDFEIDYALVAA